MVVYIKYFAPGGGAQRTNSKKRTFILLLSSLSVNALLSLEIIRKHLVRSEEHCYTVVLLAGTNRKRHK